MGRWKVVKEDVGWGVDVLKGVVKVVGYVWDKVWKDGKDGGIGLMMCGEE